MYFTTLFTLHSNDLLFAASHLTSLKWLIVIFIFIPSLTMLMNLISIFISSKVNKMQTAQFITMGMLIPAFIVYGLINKGESSIFLNLKNIMVWTSVTIVINILLFNTIVKLFHREKILLRY